MSEFVGLVLAAGQGKRFGQPKAAFEFNGERLVDRAVRLLNEAGAIKTYVVLGAWLGEVENALVIENKNWSEGMGSSLSTGLNYLTENENTPKVIITLVDLPGLTVEAIKKVADENAEITVGTYKGQQGHPVAFSRKYWNEIANKVSGDTGAKDFIKANPSLVKFVELSEVASGEDMDYSPEL